MRVAAQPQPARGAMPAEGEQVLRRGARRPRAGRSRRCCAPSPWPRPSPSLSRIAGRLKRSATREATMPTTPSCQSGDESTSAGGSGSATMRSAVGDHGRLDGLPLLVELVEAQRQRQGRPAVVAAEQLQGERRVLQAAGRVEPRPEPEADRAGVDAVRLDAGDLHERGEPRPRRAAQATEADRRRGRGSHRRGARRPRPCRWRRRPCRPRSASGSSTSSSRGSSSRACASLKATPTPARCGQG